MRGLRLTRGNVIDEMIDELAISCKDVPNDSSSPSSSSSLSSPSSLSSSSSSSSSS
jgi:hypothetical protein